MMANGHVLIILMTLQLIQVWAETFRNQPDLSGVVQSYQELKNKGIEFPAPEIESVVPIYTPQRVSGRKADRLCVTEGAAPLCCYHSRTR